MLCNHMHVNVTIDLMLVRIKLLIKISINLCKQLEMINIILYLIFVVSSLPYLSFLTHKPPGKSRLYAGRECEHCLDHIHVKKKAESQ